MKIRRPKNLGRWITNISFILAAVALVVAIGGRIFAQDGDGSAVQTGEDGTTHGGGGASFDDAVVGVQFGGDGTAGMPGLNTTYIDSTSRSEEFTEGAECAVANIDCFTKNYQSSQILGYTGLAVGDESTASAVVGTGTGALQGVGKMIAWTFQPQASGAYYVADALQNMGAISPAYAQGYGYYSLSPYLKLWRIFRNIAYIFFTIVIIVIGFMILLRQKAGGQAAVTAQQALPRIVLALILVTFSYAIAGFLIDLMYWIMYAFTYFLDFNGEGSFGGANDLVNGDFGTVMKLVSTGGSANIFASVNGAAENLFKSLTGVDGWVKDLIGGLAGIIATFIIIIALVSSLFRLLFILLKSYAVVLLNIIFAPLNLMMVAFSGMKVFTKWFMSIVANLSPFIITFFMLVIVGTLNSFFNSVNGEVAGGFSPPYLFGGTDAAGMTNSLGTVIGLAICLAIPELVTNIKKKLGGDGGIFGEIAGAAGANFMKHGGNTVKNVGTKAVKGALGVGAGVAMSVPGALGAGARGLASRIRTGDSSRGFFRDFGRYYHDNSGPSTFGTMVRGGVSGGASGAWSARRHGSNNQDYKTYTAIKKKMKSLRVQQGTGGSADTWLQNYSNYTQWTRGGRPTK